MTVTLLRLQIVACLVVVPLALAYGYLAVGLWFVAALALGAYSLGRRTAPTPAPLAPTKTRRHTP